MDIIDKNKLSISAICRISLILVVFLASLYGAIHWGYKYLAPDELQRIKVPNFILNHHHLPFGTEESVRISLWGFSYAMQPYFPSILAALFMNIGHILNLSLVVFNVSLWARLVSVIAGTATTFLAFKIGDKVFSKKSSVFLFAALTGLIPQFIYLSSYFNNDIFSVFTTYLVVYAWLSGKASGWSWKDCVTLSLGLAMCMLTYYFAYAFVVCSIIVFNATMKAKKDRQPKEWLKKELFIIGLVFILAGWFFIWNYFKFHDFIGIQTSAYYGELYGSSVPPLKPSLRLTPQNLHQSVTQMLFKPSELAGWGKGKNWFNLSWDSFIGNFGMLQLQLPNFAYKLYTFIIGLGFLLGLTKGIYKSFKIKVEDNIIQLCLVLCLISPVLFSIYFSYASDFQPQGRYIVSMMLPLFLYTTIGYEVIDEKLKYANIIISTLITVLFLFFFFTVMLPKL